MRRSVALALALCTVALAFFASSTASHATPAPLGGTAILELNKHLFAAVDSGDEERVKSFFGSDSSPCFLVDVDGKPTRTDAANSAASFARWASDTKKEGGFATDVSVVKYDCPSGEVSYAVMDLERKPLAKDGVPIKLRATTLVRYEGNAWKLFHFHISRADSPSDRKLAAK